MIEMIIDQESGRRGWSFGDGRECLGEAGGLDGFASPTAQKRLHAVEHGGLVVDAQGRDAGKLARLGSRLLARRQRHGCGARKRYRYRETRTAAGARAYLDRAAEHARNAFDDR